MKNIDKKLKAWRKRIRATQEQGAVLCGVPLDTYRSWEQKKRVPSGDNLERVLRQIKKGEE